MGGARGSGGEDQRGSPFPPYETCIGKRETLRGPKLGDKVSYPMAHLKRNQLGSIICEYTWLILMCTSVSRALPTHTPGMGDI